MPLAVAAAAAGFGLSYPWGRIDPWAVLAPLLVFAVYGAPVLLSGDPTFTGYIKLDDTATWFALTDRVMEHGRNIDGLAPSSYEATLAFNLADGYPIGAFLPLGVGRALVGQDVAWVFQPYLAFVAAMAASSLYVLAGTVLRSGPARLVAAVVGAQPALLLGYVLWGGVKEIVAAALVAVLAGLVAVWMADEDGPRGGDFVLMAVVCAAVLATVSAAGGVWLLGVLLPAAWILARRHGPRLMIRGAAVVALGAGALSIPLIVAGGFVPPTSSPVTSDTAKGNLVEPLSPLQIFGVWPEGDFRFRPEDMLATHVLIGTVALAAGIGLFLAWRRRAVALLVFVAGTVAAAFVIVAIGSPWIDAKALATASPAVVFAALIGAGLTIAAGRRVAGAVLALVVCGGVLWSNVLAYHEVNLAPYQRHSELAQIGDLIAGQGPALMTEYEPYGVRHFLRKADAEGASELRRRLVPLRSGKPLRKLSTADVDEFDLSAIRAYRTLVLRRSPVASRPPSVYRLLSRGRFYDVWQLIPGREDSLLEHLPLGRPGRPAARPACAQVRGLAQRASSAGGRLAVSRVPAALRVDLGRADSGPPGQVRPVPGMPGAVYPGPEAGFEATIRVRRPGDYVFFVGGAFRRELELSVDGRQVASKRHRLSHEGQYEPLAEVDSDTRGNASHRPQVPAGGAGSGQRRACLPARPSIRGPGGKSEGRRGSASPGASTLPAAPRLDRVGVSVRRRRPALRKMRGPGHTRPSLLCNLTRRRCSRGGSRGRIAFVPQELKAPRPEAGGSPASRRRSKLIALQIPENTASLLPGRPYKSRAQPNMTAGSCKGSQETNNKLTGQSENPLK